MPPLSQGKAIKHPLYFALSAGNSLNTLLQYMYKILTFQFIATFDSNMKSIFIKLESNLKFLSGFLKRDPCG